jgi:hypothetical protein
MAELQRPLIADRMRARMASIPGGRLYPWG